MPKGNPAGYLPNVKAKEMDEKKKKAMMKGGKNPFARAAMSAKKGK